MAYISYCRYFSFVEQILKAFWPTPKKTKTSAASQHLSAARNQLGRAVPITLWSHTWSHTWSTVKTLRILVIFTMRGDQCISIWGGGAGHGGVVSPNLQRSLVLEDSWSNLFLLFLIMQFTHHLSSFKSTENTQETNPANPAGTKSSWHCGLSRFSRCFSKT